MIFAPAVLLDCPVIGPLLRWQSHLGGYAWHWVQTHGPLAMFVLLFTSGIGLPLPEDVPLLAAGVAIARHSMTWSVAAPIAWVAMMFGDSALYILGYVLGYRVVHLPMIGRHVSAARLKRCELWFDRWGIWAVGIGRMFAGIRTAIVVTAGTMRFNYPKLLLADGIAAIVSGGAFMILGYWAGHHAGEVRELIEQYRLYISSTLLVAGLVLLAFLMLRSRRRAAALATKSGNEVAAPIKPI